MFCWTSCMRRRRIQWLQRAMRIHPTAAEFLPTVLSKLKTLRLADDIQRPWTELSMGGRSAFNLTIESSKEDLL